MAWCPSVCLSVTSRFSSETAEWIELVFDTEAILTVIKKFGYLQKYGYFHLQHYPQELSSC